MHRLSIKIIITALKFIVLVCVGIVITWVWAGWIPFDGPELGIGNKIGCGYPSGFPVSFIGTWKYAEGILNPQCAIDVNYPAFALNILFWTGVLYLVWHLIKRIILKLK